MLDGRRVLQLVLPPVLGLIGGGVLIGHGPIILSESHMRQSSRRPSGVEPGNVSVL